MLGFIIRALIAALGLWSAASILPGLRIDTPTHLVLAGLLLGVVNAIVRPIVIVLTLPATLVTLGLFLLVINAAMVGLVAWLVPGMRIDGFWTAFWAAIVVSVVSMIGSALIGSKGKIELARKR